MPLTFVHPVAVLPLKRKIPWLETQAMVIGAMVPDIPYYFPIANNIIEDSHTFYSTLVFSLPMGVFFYCVVKALSPAFWYSLCGQIRQTRVEKVTVTQKLVSLWVGAFTHIFWDGFTHGYGWAAKLFPLLQLKLFSYFKSNLYFYSLLQHLSTVIGGIILMCWLWKNRYSLKGLKPNWVGVWLIIAVISCFEGIRDGYSHTQFHSTSVFIFYFITVSTRVFIVLGLIYLFTFSVLRFFKSQLTTKRVGMK